MDTPTRRSGSERRQMDAVLVSRLRSDERDLIVSAARARSISVSELVRTTVLAEVARG